MFERESSLVEFVLAPEQVDRTGGRDPLESPGFLIYRNLIRARFVGALSTSLPLTCSILGERLTPLVVAFLADGGSSSLSLSGVCRDFVRSRPWTSELPDWLEELAEHELLKIKIAAAPEIFVRFPLEVTPSTRLSLHPACVLVRRAFPVHRLTVSSLQRTLEKENIWVLGYRDKDDEVRFLELSNFGVAVLRALDDGACLVVASQRVLAEQTNGPSDAALAELAHFLNELSIRELLVLPPGENPSDSPNTTHSIS